MLSNKNVITFEKAIKCYQMKMLSHVIKSYQMLSNENVITFEKAIK